MAGEEGFEPSHTWFKATCLTAWLLPNIGPGGKSRTYVSRLSVVHSTVELHPEIYLTDFTQHLVI